MAKMWQTVTGACQSLGISQRTLYRRIKKGDIESKVEDNRRLVLVDVPDGLPEADNGRQVASGELVTELRSRVEHLEQELDKRNQQIDQQNMIVMQLTRQLEQSQRLLEHHRDPWAAVVQEEIRT